jgi:hypothetical protein
MGISGLMSRLKRAAMNGPVSFLSLAVQAGHSVDTSVIESILNISLQNWNMASRLCFYVDSI